MRRRIILLPILALFLAASQAALADEEKKERKDPPPPPPPRVERPDRDRDHDRDRERARDERRRAPERGPREPFGPRHDQPQRGMEGPGMMSGMGGPVPQQHRGRGPGMGMPGGMPGMGPGPDPGMAPGMPMGGPGMGMMGGGPGMGGMGMMGGPGMGPGRNMSPADREMFELNQADQRLERASHELAMRFRQAKGEDREKIAQELDEVVNEHFNIRQKRRRFEIEQLERELKKLLETVQSREEARDEIVGRRLMELKGEDDRLRF